MKVFKYILAVFFITAALGGVIQKQFPISLIFIILGILILPAVSEQLREKSKLWRSKGMRYATYIILLSIAGVTMDKNKLPKPLSGTSKALEEVQTKTDQPNNIKISESGKSGVYNANGENVGTVTDETEEPMDDSDFWKSYSPEVRIRIHELIKNKDCQGLQNEFDTADRNNQAQKRRTGRNNAELLDFIDNNMYKMGCYGK